MDWRGFSANKHTPGVAIQSLWLWLRCCAFQERREGKKAYCGWLEWELSNLFPFVSFFLEHKNIIQQVPFLSSFSSFSAVQRDVTDAKAFRVEKKMCEMKIPFRYQTSFITGRRVKLGFASRVTVELSLSVIPQGFMLWRHESNGF